MGQQASSSNSLTQSVTKILNDVNVPKLLPDTIITMKYEEFLAKLDELNKLLNTCLDASGKKLLFAIKVGTDTTFLWKATIQIACVQIHAETQKVETYRLLSLREFIQVYNTLQNQYLNAASSSSTSAAETEKLTLSTLYDNMKASSKEEATNECCICFERKADISLPCTHVYCMQCIEEWNEDHHNCPICRAQLKSTDDTWVLSEVPHSEEISEELRYTLMNLAEDHASSSCRPF